METRPESGFVVRRLLDGRDRVPLAHEGRTGNHPTAAVNLAHLVLTCAEQPAQRVLNSADPDTPTAHDVVVAIAGAYGNDVQPVGLPDHVAPEYGTPWEKWPPYFLDTTAAEALGYRPVGTYADTVVDQVAEWLTLTPAERGRLDNADYFRDPFDYTVDDAALAVAGAT